LGLPEHARSNREGQIFLVNRRWIQSPSLSQAVRQAYGNLLPSGRFPAVTVWLTVPSDHLDVNVHPTKREVRFADESAVFGLVAAACARPLASLHPPFTVVPGGAPDAPTLKVSTPQPSVTSSTDLYTSASQGSVATLPDTVAERPSLFGPVDEK